MAVAVAVAVAVVVAWRGAAHGLVRLRLERHGSDGALSAQPTLACTSITQKFSTTKREDSGE